MRKRTLLATLVVIFAAPAVLAAKGPVPGASFIHAPASSSAEGSAAPPADEPDEPNAAEAITPLTSVLPIDAERPDKQGLPLVAVLDLRAGEGDGPLASALGTVVTAELAARDDVRAVSRNELQALLAHKAEQALLGCESVKCAADLGKLVEADLVITGGVERPGEAFVFSLSLIDPVAGEVKQRVEATWRSAPEEMVVLARPYVDRLLAGPRAATFTGALDVLAPDGAEVFLDGRSLGLAPLPGPTADLPIGVHTLEVAKAGFVTDRRDVVVSRGETTVVRVELEEQPLLSQWWFWTAVGGGSAVALAAGATIGTVAILALGEPPPTTLKVNVNLPTGAK